jgi:hypothetical protein
VKASALMAFRKQAVLKSEDTGACCIDLAPMGRENRVSWEGAEAICDGHVPPVRNLVGFLAA